MNSGLMWYDSDPRKPASVKIDEATRRYREKFGAEPNACHVSPDLLVTHDRVQVVANRWIRRNYFWLGVDEQLPPARRKSGSRRSEDAESQCLAMGASSASATSVRRAGRRSSCEALRGSA